MATHTMIVRSSSSALAASSPLKETLPLFTTRSLTFPRKSSFSRLRLRFFAEKLSQLDSSNGCASLQDCKTFLPSSSFLEPLCVWTVWFTSLSFGRILFFVWQLENILQRSMTQKKSHPLLVLQWLEPLEIWPIRKYSLHCLLSFTRVVFLRTSLFLVMLGPNSPMRSFVSWSVEH